MGWHGQGASACGLAQPAVCGCACKPSGRAAALASNPKSLTRSEALRLSALSCGRLGGELSSPSSPPPPLSAPVSISASPSPVCGSPPPLGSIVARRRSSPPLHPQAPQRICAFVNRVTQIHNPSSVLPHLSPLSVFFSPSGVIYTNWVRHIRIEQGCPS
jgi:hypothetical protein